MARKRSRFTIDDDGIVVTGRRVPTLEEQDEADRIFNRILKNRKRT
jgi:hypothetical protein